ncbi:MAG: hypothetical protein R3E68_15800 [Burkholderiaceae bacterium]
MPEKYLVFGVGLTRPRDSACTSTRLGAVPGLPAGTDLAAAVTELNRRLGSAGQSSRHGVRSAIADSIVSGALADHSIPTNPRPLDARALRGLFDEALG